MAEGTATASAMSSRGYMPRWFNFGRAFIEIGSGMICIGMQFNTTRDTIFNIMQAGTQVPAHMSTQQLMNFLDGNASKLNSEAFIIALVTQIAFWWIALPATKNGHKSKPKKAVMILLFVLEVLSDLQFASGSTAIINGDLTRVFTTGGFAWVGIALFAICVSVGSSFVFLNGIRVLGNALENQPE